MKFAFCALLSVELLSSCSNEWTIDRHTPPKAWTTHPFTKHLQPIRASYNFLGGDAVDASIKIPFFPFPYVERGVVGKSIVGPNDWVVDVTFHGITERYWGHIVYTPKNKPYGEAILTVIPLNDTSKPTVP
jgi:hypothetical protein